MPRIFLVSNPRLSWSIHQLCLEWSVVDGESICICSLVLDHVVPSFLPTFLHCFLQSDNPKPSSSVRKLESKPNNHQNSGIPSRYVYVRCVPDPFRFVSFPEWEMRWTQVWTWRYTDCSRSISESWVRKVNCILITNLGLYRGTFIKCLYASMRYRCFWSLEGR